MYVCIHVYIYIYATPKKHRKVKSETEMVFFYLLGATLWCSSIFLVSAFDHLLKKKFPLK